MKIKKLLGLALAAALFMAGIPDVVEAQRQVRVFTGGATAPTGTLDGDIWIDNSGNVSILTFGSFRRVGSRSSGSAVATVATTDANAIAAGANSSIAAAAAALGTQAQGTLTVDTNPTDTDTMTIDATVYTFQSTLTEANCNILIGAAVGDTQTNITNAIAASGGTPGTDYATACVANPTVTSAAFAGDASVITNILNGTGGNSTVTTETFTEGTNVFDAAALGTTTSGAEATYASVIAVLVNEIRTDLNTLVTLTNELRTDYGTARTLINENKAQLNALLTQLRNAEIINQ